MRTRPSPPSPRGDEFFWNPFSLIIGCPELSQISPPFVPLIYKVPGFTGARITHGSGIASLMNDISHIDYPSRERARPFRKKIFILIVSAFVPALPQFPATYFEHSIRVQQLLPVAFKIAQTN
jgi:hypothetical protein